jgi:hypothetical protein
MEAVRGAKPVLVALFAVISCGGGSSAGGDGEDTSVVVGHPPRQAPPAFAVGGSSIELPATTIAPGEELQPCFIFPLALTGPSHMVGGGKLTVGKGMHHGNIVSRKSTAKAGRRHPPLSAGGQPRAHRRRRLRLRQRRLGVVRVVDAGRGHRVCKVFGFAYAPLAR